VAQPHQRALLAVEVERRQLLVAADVYGDDLYRNVMLELVQLVAAR
jgi:hypothetical protein